MASRNYYTSVVMGSTFSNTKSLQFNGTTGYLRIPSPSASLQLNGLTNSHTISVWLKYPSIPANHLVIGNSANTVTKGFGMGYFAGRWYYWFSAGGANRMFQASPMIKFNVTGTMKVDTSIPRSLHLNAKRS
jgi:hypothetical protein